ncbi:MAG: alpha/beta hydrolase [Thiohalocapsa sp.]|jgi:hypothetical protein|uniref:alpha/beta hydrolase n=1 Tax=Thiohalocapsa sp. TaxID=2497641 RepID=UPI0025FCF266|nr:alpha/beta hydrolase [Thiohalocapsa sp.]MCG6940036.1 alpha/beta hydrolase [Thiohalocapsa sp.]
MKEATLAMLLGGVLTLLLAGILVWLLQPKLLFRPYHEIVGTPSQWGLAFNDVWLTTSDGVRLHGWYLPASRRRHSPHTLLFLHGNAGNISHRSASIGIFSALKVDQLIIDYRGYGQSDGTPGETGLYRDADAAWRWLTGVRGIAPADVVVFGRSLGGAVATELAARVQPGALIVESSFTDIESMARLHHPWLARLMPLRYRFPSAEHLARVHCPVLVLHSPDDGVVPFAHGRALYAAAPGPKRFMALAGGHNEGFLDSQPHYQQALADFLDWRAAAP